MDLDAFLVENGGTKVKDELSANETDRVVPRGQPHDAPEDEKDGSGVSMKPWI
jgi:hypothetical protein